MVGDDPNVILMAAVKNQLMSAGLNRYLPYSTVGQMGATPYFVRSGFNGGLDFAQDTRPKEFPREQLRRGIAECKRLRKFWLGDFYPLSEATANTADWVVLQYHRPEASDGIVVAFRRHRSPYTGYQCRLRAIDPEATYEVTLSHTYDPEKPVRMKGEELTRLNLAVPDCPGSVLVEYRRVAATGH
jgi:alpha-galactosidase